MAKKKPVPEYMLSGGDGMDWDFVDGFLATAAQSAPVETEQEQGTGRMRRYAGDTGVSLLKGAIGVAESGIGLADMATGGRVGKAAEEAGIRPKEARAFLDTMLSPEQQAANRAVEEAEGFTGKVGAAVSNPSTIVQSAVESVPLMMGGGVMARALMKAAPAVPGAVAVGVGEGVVGAGSSAEQIRQETDDGLLTGKQSAIAAGSGALTAGISAISAGIARKLGIGDVDSLIAGVKAAGQQAEKGLIRKVLEGAVTEGVLEELPQSISDQVAHNMALGKPLEEGVDHAAAMGLLTGAAMGGAVGPIAGRAQAPEQNGVPELEATPQPGTPAATVPPEAGAQAATVPPDVGGSSPQPSGSQPETLPVELAPPQELSPGDIIRQEKLPEEGPAARAVNAPIEAVAQQADGEAIADAAEQQILAEAEPQPVGNSEQLEPEAALDDVIQKLRTNEQARAQREADRPPAPTGEMLPDDIVVRSTGRPFQNMHSAMSALSRAGDGYELVRVTDGLVVRKQGRIAQTVEPGAMTPSGAGSSPAPAAQKAEIDAAAHEAASSPLNDRPEPTEAQAEANNAKLGHFTWNGLGVSIENPKGSVRRGTDRNGKPWETEAVAHYGYLKRTTGADGDQVDVYVGDKPESQQVFVVDQIDADTGKFDEQKAVLGVESVEEAKALYDAGFSDGKGPQRRAAITPMSVEQFKTWLKDGDTTKPVAAQLPKEPDGAQDNPAASDVTPMATRPDGDRSAQPDRSTSDLQPLDQDPGRVEPDAAVRTATGGTAAVAARDGRAADADAVGDTNEQKRQAQESKAPASDEAFQQTDDTALSGSEKGLDRDAARKSNGAELLRKTGDADAVTEGREVRPAVQGDAARGRLSNTELREAVRRAQQPIIDQRKRLSVLRSLKRCLG